MSTELRVAVRRLLNERWSTAAAAANPLDIFRSGL